MKFIRTEIENLIIIEPKIFGDSRGYFVETFKKELFEKEVGIVNFIQENESMSSKGVLRGMHLQVPPYTQAKLVRVIEGEVIDVCVDLRTDSTTFGKNLAVNLSEENKRQLFVPRGFAHGFLVLSDYAIFSYKVDNIYSQPHELGIRFDDKDLNINWIMEEKQIKLSNKDLKLSSLKENSFFTSKEYLK